jgi:transcriptional regulator with XRE-family HTH domain
VTDDRPEKDHQTDDSLKEIIGEFWGAVRALLAQYRQELGGRGERVTQQQIANDIGMPPATLSDWLREVRVLVPGWDEISELLEYLGGNLDEWLPKWRRASLAYEEFSRRKRSRSPDARPDPAIQDPSRWKDWKRIGTIVMAILIVTLVLGGGFFAISTYSTGEGAKRPNTPPRVWWVLIKNTYSAQYGKDIGVRTYKGPNTFELFGPGYDEKTSVPVVCQERHGELRTDPTTGDASAVWDKTRDGHWFPDLYSDLPQKKGDTPPRGIPKCPRAESSQ